MLLLRFPDRMSRLLCAKNTDMGNYALLCNLILLVHVSMQGRLNVKIYYRCVISEPSTKRKTRPKFLIVYKAVLLRELSATCGNWK